MYFTGIRRIKYTMRKIIRLALALLCLCAVVGGVIIGIAGTGEGKSDESGVEVVTLWQVDSFEGGKGSRAEYLRSLSNEFGRINGVYFNVASLTPEAAEYNIEAGNVADIISFGAGSAFPMGIAEEGSAEVWCNGAYCILTLNGDFTDITAENTVVNEGKENLSSVAAALSGLSAAKVQTSVSAYLSLLDGKFKYLLGTQRDIVRLQIRGASFKVLPVSAFNDLYQYISVTRTAANKEICNRFIDYVLERSSGLSKLCMFCDGLKLYSDELGGLENIKFEYGVPAIAGKEWRASVLSAAQTNTELLKSLLKQL